MASDFPIRELTSLVTLFQRAHAKVSALQRLDDQIATLVAQHQRLQDEVRTVQNEINEEFERALKYNQAPAKLPAALLEAAAASNTNGLAESEADSQRVTARAS